MKATASLNKKNIILDVLISTLKAVIFSIIGVLILAIFVKFCSLGDNVVVPLNQVIKYASILFGCIFGIKDKTSGAIKGAIIGLLYTTLSVFIFLIIDSTLSAQNFNFFDFLTGTVGGIICGIIAVNVGSKRKRH
ncbi:MAG: TIGR04086 family membrane protein [Bacillota bacterium]